MAFSPLYSLGLGAHDSLEDLTVIELMGIMVQEMDPLCQLAHEGVCGMSDMQVLDLKSPPTKQPNSSDDYTVRHARKTENASNLLLIYPRTDIPLAGGKGGQEIFACSQL